MIKRTGTKDVDYYATYAMPCVRDGQWGIVLEEDEAVTFVPLGALDATPRNLQVSRSVVVRVWYETETYPGDNVTPGVEDCTGHWIEIYQHASADNALHLLKVVDEGDTSRKIVELGTPFEVRNFILTY